MSIHPEVMQEYVRQKCFTSKQYPELEYEQVCEKAARTVWEDNLSMTKSLLASLCPGTPTPIDELERVILADEVIDTEFGYWEDEE